MVLFGRMLLLVVIIDGVAGDRGGLLGALGYMALGSVLLWVGSYTLHRRHRHRKRRPGLDSRNEPTILAST